MRRALIVNAYDIANWGDTAIVSGLIHSLRQAGYDHVTVAPVDWREPDPWLGIGADSVVRPLLSLYDTPRWLKRPKPAKLAHVVAEMVRFRYGRRSDAAMAAYEQADLVVSAGGGWMGGTKPGSNLIKVGNVRAASVAGRPAVVGPVSVAPHSSTVGRILRWGLADVPTFARDHPSVESLRGLGIPADFAPDLAFRSPVLTAAAGDAVPPTGTIGWAPRGYRKEHLAWGRPAVAQERTLEAVRRILSTSDARLRFVPHVRAGLRDDDLVAVESLLSRFSTEERARIEVAPEPGSLAEAVRQYAFLDVLVTSRMHAAIFALAVGTPSVAIGYEPKVHGVMDTIALADRVVPADERLTSESMIATIDRLRDPSERTRTLTAFRNAGTGYDAFDASIRVGI